MSFARLNDILRRAVEDGEIAGGNLLCLKDGIRQCYFEQGYADIEKKQPIQKDTIFRMYSMTKPITSAAVMLLIERGELDLLDPVYKYLEGFKEQTYYVGQERKKVERYATIRDLLCMTAGVAYPGDATKTERDTTVLFNQLIDGLQQGSPYEQMGTVAAMNELGRIPLLFSPGENWQYSTCADVLGAVVEVVAKMPFSQFLQKNIFTPLGMKDTGFYVPQEKQGRLASVYDMTNDGLVKYTQNHLAIQNNMEHPPVFESGGAGLASTIEDYGRFATMLLNKGVYNGRRILSEKTVDYMTTNHITKKQEKGMESWENLAGYSYGNLMRILTNPEHCTHLCVKGEYGWDGWLGAYFMNVPQEDLTFLLMYQRTNSGTTTLTRKLLNALYATFQ
ncbi:serine hydrolase domain-containing protein [Anaerosporobacter faecicola]|uniref:serine hydrolase domain-containing protein n=1 Tax=Anaerosporobacter faecicola TaxID=2718714 RepID=UPI00143A6431|nr:serine hydrolase domain-containing protein [Anaerosporobacter faecicola]